MIWDGISWLLSKGLKRGLESWKAWTGLFGGGAKVGKTPLPTSAPNSSPCLGLWIINKCGTYEETNKINYLLLKVLSKHNRESILLDENTEVIGVVIWVHWACTTELGGGALRHSGGLVSCQERVETVVSTETINCSNKQVVAHIEYLYCRHKTIL